VEGLGLDRFHRRRIDQHEVGVHPPGNSSLVGDVEDLGRVGGGEVTDALVGQRSPVGLGEQEPTPSRRPGRRKVSQMLAFFSARLWGA
jgi:hypothetical protein